MTRAEDACQKGSMITAAARHHRAMDPATSSSADAHVLPAAGLKPPKPMNMLAAGNRPHTAGE
jgi:hypothetical protein